MGGGLPGLSVAAFLDQVPGRLRQAAAQDEDVEGGERADEERNPPAVLGDDEKAYEGRQDPTVSPETL